MDMCYFDVMEMLILNSFFIQSTISLLSERQGTKGLKFSICSVNDQKRSKKNLENIYPWTWKETPIITKKSGGRTKEKWRSNKRVKMKPMFKLQRSNLSIKNCKGFVNMCPLIRGRQGCLYCLFDGLPKWPS